MYFLKFNSRSKTGKIDNRTAKDSRSKILSRQTYLRAHHEQVQGVFSIVVTTSKCSSHVRFNFTQDWCIYKFQNMIEQMKKKQKEPWIILRCAGTTYKGVLTYLTGCSMIVTDCEPVAWYLELTISIQMILSSQIQVVIYNLQWYCLSAWLN